MLQQNLSTIFERDLLKLKEELNSYNREADMWQLKPGISNSAGNLCLHLMGNLHHFIGAGLGHTGYIRNRTAEFELKNVPRQQLLNDIDQTIVMVTTTLQQLPNEMLEKEFPMELPMGKFPTQQFLLHLLTHLSYHLGQINYHRRLLGGV
jgi:uncharacterized damage-inducible protein DinB